MHLPGRSNTNENLLPQDGILIYRPDFIGPDEAQAYLKILTETIFWENHSIMLYGRLVGVPRLTSWYGDKEYKYSGVLNIPFPWTRELYDLKEMAEKACDKPFNTVLLNLYRDGNDHMGWHADDEKSLGTNPVIASISLGEIRKFGLKHRYDKNLKPLSFELGSGSLVIMKGEMQEYWHHRIHPTKKSKGARINLTFRNVIS